MDIGLNPVIHLESIIAKASAKYQLECEDILDHGQLL